MSLRDNLLITAAMRAAYMHDKDEIVLDTTVVGEDEIADFIVTAVADYIITESDEPFDLYIEEVLKEEFGSTISTEEGKETEKNHYRCGLYKLEKRDTTGLCNSCKYDREGSDGSICGPCWCGIEDHYEPKESDA